MDPTKRRQPTPEEEARFKELMAEGDRARLAFRVSDAVRAYVRALEIKDDALASGRLGMTILMGGWPEYDYRAATELYQAVSEAAGASRAEKNQFWEAYERLRRRVCRVEVDTNDVDTLVYKGDDRPPTRGSLFWTFVNPGIVKFKASLAGREDIEKTVECANGRDVWVSFQFPPLPPPPAPPPREKTRTVVVREPIATAPPRAELSPAADAAEAGRFRGGAGLAMVTGAAPSISLGAVVTGEYRLGGVSGLAMLKGAWALGSVEGRPIDVFTATAFAGPCAHWQWFQACALAGATLFDHRIEGNPIYRLDTNTQVVPALGLGVGATYGITSAVSARVFADAAALTRDAVIEIVAPGGTAPVWQTNRFLFSVSASLMFGR